MGEIERIGRMVRIGRIGRIGGIGRIGKIDRIGRIGRSGRSGRIGRFWVFIDFRRIFIDLPLFVSLIFIMFREGGWNPIFRMISDKIYMT